MFFLGAEFTHVYATTYGSRAGDYAAEKAGAVVAPKSERITQIEAEEHAAS